MFSDLPLIELFLNGASLGSAPCTPGGFASFADVPFTPGNLTAAGKLSAGGAVLAVHTQLAAGAPASIELTLDAPSLATGTGTALLLDGHDAGLVRATVRDAGGRVVNTARNLITFAVQSGPCPHPPMPNVHLGVAQLNYCPHAVVRLMPAAHLGTDNTPWCRPRPAPSSATLTTVATHTLPNPLCLQAQAVCRASTTATPSRTSPRSRPRGWPTTASRVRLSRSRSTRLRRPKTT